MKDTISLIILYNYNTYINITSRNYVVKRFYMNYLLLYSVMIIFAGKQNIGPLGRGMYCYSYKKLNNNDVKILGNSNLVLGPVDPSNFQK